MTPAPEKAAPIPAEVSDNPPCNCNGAFDEGCYNCEDFWRRATFAGLAKGQHVFVLGSAPSASLNMRHPSDLLVCVNGSLAPFQDLIPDVLVINSATLTSSSRPTSVGSASVKALRGRRVGHLVCITSFMPFSQMLKELHEIGLSWESCEEITKVQRARFVSDFLQHPLASAKGGDVASTGVSAILIARAAGAASVRWGGISLDGGHSYIKGDTPRGHKEIDEEVLRRLRGDAS